MYPQVLPTIRIGGNLTKGQYQYTMQDADLQTLYRAAPLMFDRMKGLPGFLDVNSDLQITSPQVLVEIDREKASALGVTAVQIENALNNAYGAPQVSTIYTPTNQYWVMMELLPQYQRDPAALSMLYIRSSSGKLVPLGTVAKLTRTVGPLTVNHLGQLPAVTISFNLQPGRGPRRGGRADPEGGARACACPPRSAPASRGRCRPSSARSRAWASCCWPRCW